MKVYCPKGLHLGVFQALDKDLCLHEFYVNAWDEKIRPKPNNVFVMTKEMMEDPDDAFFGAILVQSEEDYNLISKFDKPIVYYHLINSRGRGMAHIYSNPRVFPVYLCTSCKFTYSMYEGMHKTIYHGVDSEVWKGWTGEDKRIVAVKNLFEQRDKARYDLFKDICKNHQHTLLGQGGDFNYGLTEQVNFMKKCRLFLNVEIVASPFDTSCVEAMMLGMPIVSSDTESSSEFIRNGIEGFISNNVDYLKKKVNDLMNDDAMAKEMGANARKTALQRFSKEQFNMQWNDYMTNLDLYKRQ